MSDEQRYLEFLEVGPNASGLDTVRWAMRYEGTQPQETLRLRRVHEQSKREADAVMLYEETAMARGASAEEARRASE